MAELLSAYEQALQAGAASLGIALSPALVAGMAKHHALVVQWAARINLTTIKDPVEAARLHGLDSLLFTELLPDDAPLATLDVGSGAGFPGIVVALARTRLRMTLLEPLRKRASFLRVALTDLGRADVAVVEGRLEPGRSSPGGRGWDVILSRATLPPLELIACAGPELRSGGRLIVTSGRGAPEVAEMTAAGAPAALEHAERRSFALPGGEQRFLDVLVRPGPTPFDG